MADIGEVKVKSLKKAMDILSCFGDNPVLGVTELSERFCINKSTVHNILSTFQAMGYLEQDEGTGKYKLGIQIFNLSKALGDTYSITKIAAPYMQELANLTKMGVYLAVYHDWQALYLEAMYPIGSFELMRNILGTRAELYCTGLGKAMLANLPEKEIRQYLKRSFRPYTNHTITDSKSLWQELALTRQRGYAVDNMEHEFGIRCVAVPVFSRDQRIYAAMSISGDAASITDELAADWAVRLKECVRKIQGRL